MVFVPDADIITQTGVTGKEGIAEMMGYLLEIIHRQIQSLLSCFCKANAVSTRQSHLYLLVNVRSR